MEKCKYSQYRHKRKKKKSLKKALVITIVSVFLFAVFIGYYMEFNVNPVILDVSEAKANAITANAISQAVEFEFGNYTYDDLMTIERDADGRITSMRANVALANLLAMRSRTLAQKYIDEMGSQGIAVPIGTISGIPLLIGRGPSITIRMMSIGAVTSYFESHFVSAGINQTVHRLSIIVNADVSIILPAGDRRITGENEIMITESLIVGQIPPFYMAGGLTGFLNPGN
ncbi:MAG: sporulation protein YunB [Firmicutes bacterium]|nr:sporulation protein YunB [Bacillota bacterium]